MRLTSSRFARMIPAALLLLAFTVVPALAKRMDVEVWTDRGNDAVYEPGDAMRVKVRTTEDAYLLVYEIDSEGNVSLLYPMQRGSGRVEARRTMRLPDDASSYELVVEKATGQGFLVAVASERPFRDLPWYLRPFDPQAASVGYEGEPDGKDEEGFDDKGRVVGDPYVAMERIRRRVMSQPGDAQDFASSYSTYYVHEQVRYPRYMCNDCHRPHNWAWWDGFDPYYARCSVVDFRVNWSWCWGPQMWTSFMPYYYYCVRSDCPPRYQHLYDSRTRFSSWDGWQRWNSLWGGELRRFKPAPAPLTYVPPPPRGIVWHQGQTPPGFVPPDVRRQPGTPGGGSGTQGWMQRDRGDGHPVWRQGPRSFPAQGGGNPPPSGGDNRRYPDWRPRGGDTPQGGQGGQGTPSGQGGEGERRHPEWNPGNSGRNDPPRNDPPRNDPPRNDPPRRDPPRQDPPRDQPQTKSPPPPMEYPKWSPPPPKPKGHGG